MSNDDQFYATVSVSSAKPGRGSIADTSRSSSASKSPRKHQKQNRDLSANASANAAKSDLGDSKSNLRKDEMWPLTSSKQNDRNDFSSSEDLAICSKGIFIIIFYLFPPTSADHFPQSTTQNIIMKNEERKTVLVSPKFILSGGNRQEFKS